MILSRPDIIKYIEEGKLIFDPEVSIENIDQVSIDLRLGSKFTVFKDPPEYLPSIRIDRSLFQSEDLWQRYDNQETYRLNPGQFVLAQTLESVHIPDDLVGLVEGRSTWARLGVTIHLTAPKIDPGFNGQITLEMANLGRIPVELRAGIDKPAQLMLLKLTRPVPPEALYGQGEQDAYQNQTDPIPSKR